MKPTIVKGSLVSLGIRLLDLPCRYGFHLLIAASLGVADTGRFYIVFGIMTALAGLGRLGVDQALTRQLAIDLAGNQPAAPRANVRYAIRLVLFASTALSLALAAAAPFLAHDILNKPDLVIPLTLGALTLVPQNLGAALAGALAGMHRVGMSQAIYSWLWPALFCLFALIAIAVGELTVNVTLVLIALSFSCAALVGALLFWRTLASIPADASGARRTALLRPGLSLFTLELTRLLLASAPAIVLGIVATAREAGLFALAWRIALIINLLISAVTAMAMPRFAGLHAQGDRDALERTAAQAIGLLLMIALPLTAAMLLAPQLLLSFFGHGYSDGATTLRILALGQLAACSLATMPELLGMTAHRDALLRLNVVTMMVLLLALAGLSPLYGSAGAAWATTLATALNGLLATLFAARLLGVTPHRRIYHSVRGTLSRG